MAEDKGSTASKTAAAGAAPVSDEKAANTSEEYQQLTGQADQPASDSDPVMDSIRKAEEEALKDTPERKAPPIINQEYERQRAKAFEDRESDEDEDEDEEQENVPDADHAEVGSFVTEVEEGGDDSGSSGSKTPAKKTASSKS